MAFFAGVGTVVVAVAAGLGGGLLMGDIMSPQIARPDTARAERRAPPEQKAPSTTAAAAHDQLTPVPYLAAVQPAANAPVVVAPAPESTQASPPRNETANAIQQQAPQPAPASTANDANAASTDAKAQAADQKRLAERRRTERRQQWAERRRYQQPREDDLGDVEQQVREDSERRDGMGREYVERQDDGDRPVRMEFPRMLFGPE
ncbi:MAG: hypothetical protein WCB02_07310 [Bradyrhizobium sp.]